VGVSYRHDRHDLHDLHDLFRHGQNVGHTRLAVAVDSVGAYDGTFQGPNGVTAVLLPIRGYTVSGPCFRSSTVR